jgi:L-malate glycosyltransferase
MKIAIISTMGSLPWGGSEYLWAATAEEALLEEHEVFISIYDWTIDHPIVKRLSNLGAHILPRVRFTKPQSIMKRVTNRLVKVQSTSPYQAVFDHQPDVICISQGNTYDVAYIPDLQELLYSRHIPYIIVCQFNSDILSLSNETRELISNLFIRAKQVAFVAKSNHQVAERHLACAITNSVIIKNPVNLKDKSLVDFPISPIKSFACVARLETAWKGQDILIESFSSEEWKDRNWVCRFYGSGPDKDYITALAKFYQLSSRIKLMGHVDNIRSIWEKNHILVLPSRGEGTPLSLVEAMICGRPAVVTNVGGNTEWVQENTTGFIADAPTTQLVNKALNRAWNIQDKWGQMGEFAHELAINKIDPHPEKTLLDLLKQQSK